MACELTSAVCSEDSFVEDGMGKAPSPLSNRAWSTAESFDVSLRLTLGVVMVAAEAISAVSCLMSSLFFLSRSQKIQFRLYAIIYLDYDG